MAAGIYDEVLWVEVGGRIETLKNTSVTVKNPDGSNATLYTDATGTTTVAQPITSDAKGNLRFFAKVTDAGYDLVYTPPGQAQQTYRVRPGPGLAAPFVPGLVSGGVTDNSAAILAYAANNDVLRFAPGYYNLGGLVAIGPGKTILADGVRFKGGFECTGGSLTVRGNHRYEPVSTSGAGSLDFGVRVMDGTDVHIEGPTFDRTAIALRNTTTTNGPRRVQIRGCTFLGDLGPWAAGQPLETYGMGSVVVTDCHWDVTNAYRFAKLSTADPYNNGTSPVGPEGYTSRLVFANNVMFGSMSASNKQVIDCYAGVGESTFADNVAIITGTAEYWLEAKTNAAAAGGPATARHNLSVTGGYVQGPFGQSVVKIQGALGETFESGPQVGAVTGSVLINTSPTADRMVVRMQQLHDASVTGCPKLRLTTEGNFNIGVLVQRCRRAVVADNNLRLGGVFIGDETATAKGQTQLVSVTGNIMDEPRYNGAITLWTIDQPKVVLANNIMRSASVTQPSVAAVFVRDGTIAELTAQGNIADFAKAGTEVIFLNADAAITNRKESGNSWSPNPQPLEAFVPLQTIETTFVDAPASPGIEASVQRGRVRVDARRASHVQFGAVLDTASQTATGALVQYSTDNGSTWTTLAELGTGWLNGVLRQTGWLAVPAAAKVDSLLLRFTIYGDGVADPIMRKSYLVFGAP